MFKVVCEESNDFNKLNPYLINHMGIMNSYGKAVLILDVFDDGVYINAVASSIFNCDRDFSNLEFFCSTLELTSKSYENPIIEIAIAALNKKLSYSLKSIKEKDEVKFILCTIEEIEELLVPKFVSRNDETILSEIVGESTKMKELKQMISKVSKSDSTVLIMGATGTGKEMFAKTIHRLSERHRQSFVAINCGAIPDSLIESELFGYDKGSFTGANQKGKIGKFEHADGGTIFLDEIENMSIFMQMKLLRVLEERKIIRVGGLEEIPIDVRILAATNSDLKEMVENGLFRRDLYYRLNIIKVNIPSLNDRELDVCMLSDYFIKMFAIKMNRNILGISDEVRKLFLSHRWDGNVRELRNIIESAMNFEEGLYITKGSLPSHFFYNEGIKAKVPSFRTLAELEREEIERALDYFGWDDKGKAQVAKVLDISRSSIYRKVLKISEKE